MCINTRLPRDLRGLLDPPPPQEGGAHPTMEPMQAAIVREYVA